MSITNQDREKCGSTVALGPAFPDQRGRSHRTFEADLPQSIFFCHFFLPEAALEPGWGGGGVWGATTGSTKTNKAGV